MNNVEKLKEQITKVKREISNEPDNRKKQRLNKYKQKLEIELRDYTRFKNGGKLVND